MVREAGLNLFKILILVCTQRPLVLHGHERAITQIRYNRDGDLLFSVAKDNKPTVWYSDNGERLGTYDGHGGAVWCIDVNSILSKYSTNPRVSTVVVPRPLI